MVICKMRGPVREAGWEHRVLDFEILPALPVEPLTVDRARFPEHRLEFSFLREPSVLLAGLGLTTRDRMVLLRQVSEVDLYLSMGDSLHLLEIKGITGPRPFQSSLRALRQITDYWLKNGRWFRTNHEPVKLWSLCPVDWKNGGPKLPIDLWASELSELNATSLQGQYLADIGLAFYSVFSWPVDGSIVGNVSIDEPGVRDLLFVMWRADEPPPTIATKD